MICKLLHALAFFLCMLSAVSGISRENVTNMPCFPHQFQCDSGKCIRKSHRCDGDIKDCGYHFRGPNYVRDTSDEVYCGKELWTLNRFERYERVRNKATEWLLEQNGLKSDRRSRGYNPVRAAVALFMLNETYFYQGNKTGKIFSSELQIHILSRLAFQTLDEINLNELSSFVNALIAVCESPREFYGLDFVEKLRARVDALEEVSPLPLLALCNAGHRMTHTHIDKLRKIFDSKSKRLWTDMQAMAVMGLSCAARQSNSAFPMQALRQFSTKLKTGVNTTTGLVDNIKTTGLVLQALIAAGDTDDAKDFNVTNIFFNSSAAQGNDGSFVDMWETYHLLPIFSWKSLANISNSHCTEQSRRGRQIEETLTGEKRNVQFSLWLGTTKYLKTALNLRVPVNESFYGAMKIAEQMDERYRFNATMINGKPFVYSISGIDDDPERENLWYLFEAKNGLTIKLIEKSPIDYMPKNEAHLVYWYRRVPTYL